MLAVILFIKNEIKFAKKYICILFYMSLYLSACVRFLASCIISRRSLVKSSALKKNTSFKNNYQKNNNKTKQ